MASSDKAQSLINPIITAYTAAAAGESSALEHALQCGKLLNTAKETVIADKDKWGRWRTKNLPDVHEETDKIYRRLAVASEKIEGIFADCKSIRDAIAKAAKYDLDTGQLKPAKQKPPKQKQPSGSTATSQSPPATDTPTLEVTLKDKAGDEIVQAIGDEEGRIEEIVKASIAKLSPEKVCAILTEKWQLEDIQKLNSNLGVHLAMKRSGKPPLLKRGVSGEQSVAAN